MYCTVTDIQKEMQHYTFTTTSDPSTSEVTTMCEEMTYDMDSVFRTVLSLPIIDVQGLSRVKQTAVYGVVARIYRAMKDSAEQVTMYQKLYDDRMKSILSSPDSIQSGSAESAISSGFVRREYPKYPRDENTW